MEKELALLIVEDSESDAELVVRRFRKAGYRVVHLRVDTARQMEEALARGWDLVIADYSLPEFSAPAALDLLRASGLEIPFVVVSGAIGEETAVGLMKAGACDYVMKSDLSRLVPAVERELRDARIRREKRRSEEALQASEENFHRSLDESPLGVRIVSRDGETLYANQATLDIFGFDDVDGWRNVPAASRYTKRSHAEFLLRREKRRLGKEDSTRYEIEIVRQDGEIRQLQVWRKRIIWNGDGHDQVIYLDITDRKRAEEQLRETLEKLRSAVRTTVQVMVAAVETRDPYTAGHQIRCADLARAIAIELGLPAEQVDAIRMAGSIHDIGKLSIPAEILSKPTKLTEIEFSLIQEHPRKGFEMLKDVESPWPLAEIVHQHHERIDGSGYPRRLKGEEILIEARLLSVADVVEAMASHRPYRPGLGIETALEEIDRSGGILYDRAAVDACLRLIREKGYRLPQAEQR